MKPFHPGIAARMSRPLRLLIGILTLLPIVFMVVFIVIFFTTFFATVSTAMTSQRANTIPPLFTYFSAFFTLQIVIIVLVYALMALYIVDVFRNDYIVGDRKALWAVIIFFGGFVAMPVYWYLYFWRDRPPAAFTPQYPPYPPNLPYPPYPPYPSSQPSYPPMPPQPPPSA